MKSQEPEERCLCSLSEGRIASSSTFCRTASLQPWHEESHRLGCVTSCLPSHLHLKHDRLQISPGRDHLCKVCDSLWLHEASEELRSLWALTPGGTGSLFDVPLRRLAPLPPPRCSRLAAGAAAAEQALPGKGRCQDEQ